MQKPLSETMQVILVTKNDLNKQNEATILSNLFEGTAVMNVYQD